MEELEKEADKIEEVVEQPDAQPTTPVEPPNFSKTKEYSERLNRDRAKIESELRLSLAQEEGFDSWEEYQNHKQEEKIANLGYDPDSLKPIVEELLKSHPSIKEAEKIRKEREEQEALRWAKEELESVNIKYGTKYKSIEEVGEEVKKLWEKGIPLEKAYAIENLENVTSKVTEAAIAKSHSKDHLQSVKGNSTTVEAISISDEEKRIMKSVFPNITDAQIMDWYSKQKQK